MTSRPTNGGEQVGESHALGAHLQGGRLDGVDGLHRRPAEGVEDLAEVDPGEDGGREGGDIGVCNLDRVVGVLNPTDGAGDGDPDPAERADNADNDEHRATAEAINHGGASTGEDDLDGVHADLDVDIIGLALDASGVEEGQEVVGDDSVTGPLAHEGDRAVAENTIAGSAAAEQSTVIPPSLVGAVHLEMLLVLGHLQSDPSVVWVASAVVLRPRAFAPRRTGPQS